MYSSAVCGYLRRGCSSVVDCPGSVGQPKLLQVVRAFYPPCLLLHARDFRQDQRGHQSNNPNDYDQLDARKRCRILASLSLHNMIAQAPSITGASAAQAPKWPILQRPVCISAVALE
jgi:hypothetical protein